MTYSNTSHGYWLLGITIFLVFIKNLIVTIPETYINLVCLFLILTIGISHGSLDNLKGNKILILYKIKNKFIFYLAYVIVAAFFAFLWLLSPSFTLLIFLVVASYHFGKEDCTYIEWSDILYKESIEFNNKRIEQVYYFLKGSIVIWAPSFCLVESHTSCRYFCAFPCCHLFLETSRSTLGTTCSFDFKFLRISLGLHLQLQ